MFTHQLIAIAEEEHAITKLLYSGLENADEEDPEKVRQNSDSNKTKLAHQNVTGFERKKHKMEIRFGKTQNATQTNLVEFARQRKEYQKRGPKIESIEKRRKVEMRKLHAREWTGIQEAVEEAGRNTNRKRESGREGETEERRGGTNDGPLHNQVWVVDCAFADLSSSSGGAAISVTRYRADVVVKHSTFERCHATDASGGAVYVVHTSQSNNFDFTVFNCQFSNNTAGRNGGHLIVQRYRSVTVAQCSFADSWSTTDSPLDQEDPIRLIIEPGRQRRGNHFSHQEGQFESTTRKNCSHMIGHSSLRLSSSPDVN
ncbi:hypothetical protein BLNAU_11407 [Blattamonas nauphoetae]|uniref:Right handed beta helix domain-containing protein n=1 Tax=Blattamonas nauphoetae TaxID=2049346 RepID=A0ABQ9XNT1_9EUKA|nr:hypothetical protein BLNAU_11407 [Blattamonas nauphoetae]